MSGMIREFFFIPIGLGIKKISGIFICGMSIYACLLSCLCCAQQEIIVKGEVVLSKSMVDENLNEVRDIVKDGNIRDGGKKEPVHATQILTFTRSFERLEKTPEIEKATGYSREWFTSLKKNLEAMFKPKAAMETALLNRDEKTYSEAEREYEKNRRIFLDTLKNPKHPSGKKY